MKRLKISSAVILSICLLFGLSGCGNNQTGEQWKESVIRGMNHCMQSFSKHALTKDKDLKGKKVKGNDGYTGTYTADYDGFNGEEIIFGGTALERENGSNLKATYQLKISSGSAILYWREFGGEHTITEANGESTYEITLSSGDNYIILKGDNFSGSLVLEVE